MSREDGGPMSTIPRLRSLLNNASDRADRVFIQHLIDRHPETVCDAIWAEMLAARKEETR